MSSESSEGCYPGIILVIGDIMTTASGPNTVVRRLAAWLVGRGYDVTVIGTWRGHRPSLQEVSGLYGQARVLVHRRYFKDSWHFAPAILLYSIRLLFGRKRYLVDIHAVWLFGGLVLSLLARLKRWTCFFNLHGNLRPVALGKNDISKILALRIVFQGLLTGCSGLIALNEREKLDAVRILPRATIIVMSNGITLHGSPLTSMRRPEVLFLGRIDPIKNLESLIDGFHQISHEVPRWTLRIVGPSNDPRYLGQLKSRCLGLNLQDRVVFQDAAFGKEKESCFLSASLFALTSWSEGQPLTVLEAMAHGLPVLLSDRCNIHVPETCGRICGCNPTEIAQALKEMLVMSEEQLGRMRLDALSFVSREFSEDGAFGKRLSLYLSGC
ncbi:MAG: glycosyltransferase [Pseudomonadota bacterium]